MFINLANEKPAYIVEHGNDVTYSKTADKAEPHVTVPSSQFFAEYREATREEIDGGSAGARQHKGAENEARKTS